MSPPRFTADDIAFIQSLIGKGLSDRDIARRTKYSRNTIAKVRNGSAKPTTPLPGLFNDQPYERCPQCGGMVQMPCRSCAAGLT